MKYRAIWLIAIIVLSLMIITGCGGKKETIQLRAEKGTFLKTYEVFGMDCPGCHGGVEKLVNKIPGVIASQANWKEKKLVVKVSQADQVTDEEICDAVKKANFTCGEQSE